MHETGLQSENNYFIWLVDPTDIHSILATSAFGMKYSLMGSILSSYSVSSTVYHARLRFNYQITKCNFNNREKLRTKYFSQLCSRPNSFRLYFSPAKLHSHVLSLGPQVSCPWIDWLFCPLYFQKKTKKCYT